MSAAVAFGPGNGCGFAGWAEAVLRKVAASITTVTMAADEDTRLSR
jgi:hypothetical protein